MANGGSASDVRVSKNALGVLFVKYPCPNCGAKLSSKADSAGASDTCPDCQASFMVPGAEKVTRFKRQEAQRAREKAAATVTREIEQDLERDASQQRQQQRQKERERLKHHIELKDVERFSAVTWCMHQCYLTLEVYFWGSAVLGGLAIVISFIGACFADNVLRGLVGAAVVTFCVVLGWSLLVGWIGFISVLFEIEKNTRVMRLKQDKN